MGSRVFWAVVFGFLGGVFVQSFLALGWSAVFFCLVLAATALAFVCLDPHKRSQYVLVAVALFSCALGAARMHAAGLSGDPQLTALVGRSVVLEGEVVAEPDMRENSTLVVLVVSKIISGTSAVPVLGKVLAQLPPHAQISYGDSVQVAGTLQLPEAFATTGDRQFDYPEYLAAQGIAYTLRFARLSERLDSGGNPVYKSVIAAKEAYLAGIRRTIPDPEAALAGGITVGDKRSIGADLTNDFQRDSLVHMVVLSGYNITIVLNAVAQLLEWAPRVFRFGGALAVVAGFLLVSGGATSAARAGLMALIAVFARQTHRVYVGERALAAVSLVLVGWNPWILCFDPSFQLSALATLGLMLYTPLFARAFAWVPEQAGLREILASTCATQLMVVPLLLYQNGMLSLVALPANIVALVPVPFAMFFSGLAAIAGMLFGTHAALLALPAYALLWYIITVAHLFAAIPFAAVVLPAFGVLWVAGAYLLLAAFYWYAAPKAA